MESPHSATQTLSRAQFFHHKNNLSLSWSVNALSVLPGGCLFGDIDASTHQYTSAIDRPREQEIILVAEGLRLMKYEKVFGARCGIWLSMAEGGESFEAKMQKAINNEGQQQSHPERCVHHDGQEVVRPEKVYKRGVSKSSELPEIKKLKTTKPTFKRKGNEEQYKLNL
ncbi:hypothetical protein Bbelb_076390 [Branchiostoma belcheri]|nr:hypothetical protein Bbelb_076390 [Branchiostoma belcheri]